MLGQQDSPATQEQATQGKRIALVIGVNGAPGYCKIPLQYAVNDATAMAEVLQQSCGFELLESPLLNEEASSDRVKEAVRRLARQRSDDDFLLLYFSGHGQPMMVDAEERDIYLVTSNFSELDVEEDMHSHVSMRWLRDKLYIPTRAGRVLLILDCCYAGDVGRTNPDPYLEDLQRRITYYFGEPGATSGAGIGGLRIALAATGHHAEATEKDGHGLMTGLLLHMLRGEVDEVIEEQGDISIQRVYRCLEQKMPSAQKASLSGGTAGRDCILTRYTERAAELRAKRTSAPVNERPHSYLPFRRDPFFQERPGEFARLEALLFGRKSEQPPLRLGLVAVTGMGGVGKTQLAVELAYRFQGRIPGGIFWMSATGKDLSFWQQQFAQLAFDAGYLSSDDDPSNMENERRRAIHFCRYLADHQDSLLILDNVESPGLLTYAIPALVGKEPACTILYTSRNQSVPDGMIPYVVEQLPESASLSLLLATTRPTLLSRMAAGNIDAETQAAQDICRQVGYLPLPLIHLRDLLKRDQRMSMHRLADVLRERGTFDIIEKLFETFRLSWEQVTNERTQCLFKLACFFPEAAPIPLWLLGLASGLGEQTDIVDPLGKAYRDLHDVSLLEELSDDLARLHPLVREFGLHLVAAEESSGETLREAAGQRLASAFIDLNRLEERVKRSGYWHCLEQVRTARAYVEILESTEQVKQVAYIQRWLDRESYLLARDVRWLQPVPGLFYQQMFNRAVEEQVRIAPGDPPTRWLRQERPVRAGVQSLLRIFAGHSSSVKSVAFAPDGRYILTGSSDRTARLWDTESGRELLRLSGHTSSVESVTFAPDGRRILTGSWDKTARLWDAQSGRELQRFSGHTYWVSSVAFAPDGRRILTGSWDNTARLWDVESGRELLRFSGHPHWVSSVAFAPDGRYILTGSSDKTARLWDTESGRELQRFPGYTGREISSVAFAPNGAYLAISDAHGWVLFWRASGAQIGTLLGLYVATYEIGAIYWPDANHVWLADKGGPDWYPHIYRLQLDGLW